VESEQERFRWRFVAHEGRVYCPSLEGLRDVRDCLHCPHARESGRVGSLPSVVCLAPPGHRAEEQIDAVMQAWMPA
jgi:hypothetical protein